MNRLACLVLLAALAVDRQWGRHVMQRYFRLRME
jgi:hypothetical protein